MPSQTSKVHKHIQKKKGPTKIKALHENSRDAQRIRRAVERDNKVSKTESLKNKHNAKIISRVIHFQDNIPTSQRTTGLDSTTVHQLITAYLTRDDEELDQIRSERRAGRPPSTRQTMMEQAQEAERKEYESGFWMPNLAEPVNLTALAEWAGTWGGLDKMTFVRVTQSGQVDESAFPPRGAV